MLSRWTGAFQIAAVYVGTMVGAGFATGKEIVEFFTRFGFIGFLSLLLAGCLFIVMGTKLMLLAANTGAKNYEEFIIYLFGKTAGRVLNILFFVMLLGVTSVMVSGAGAVFEEQLGLLKITGVLLTIVLAILVLLVGIKGLFAVNTFVVPIMISFSLLMCFLSIKNGGLSDSFLKIPHTNDSWKSLIYPFSYTAFNLALAQAVLVPVASDIKDVKTIKLGAIMGGVLLSLILITSHLSLVTLTNVSDYEIPTAEIIKNLASSFYWIFILVIYGEIFTSVIGNIFGLERQIKAYINIPRLFIYVIIFLFTYFISLFDYGSLLSYLYPLFGYISILFLILLWAKDKKGTNKPA